MASEGKSGLTRLRNLGVSSSASLDCLTKEKRIEKAIDTLAVDQAIELMFAMMRKDILRQMKEKETKDWEGKLWSTEDDLAITEETKKITALLPSGVTEEDMWGQKQYLFSKVPEEAMDEDQAEAALRPIMEKYHPMVRLALALEKGFITEYAAQGIALSLNANAMLF